MGLDRIPRLIRQEKLRRSVRKALARVEDEAAAAHQRESRMRSEAMRAAQKAKIDEAMARHLFETQIEPQRMADKLRVPTAFVDVSPDAPGFTITCAGCGRTAKLPFDPGDAVGMCPACVRGLDG